VARDPSKAFLLQDAHIWIGDLGVAANPTDVDDNFGPGWDEVGLLDSDAGLTQGFTEDTGDIYAIGGILVRTYRRNYKESFAFTALERNEVTNALLYPNSTPGALFVPRPVRVKLGIDFREGVTARRLITANNAEVVRTGDVAWNETSLAGIPFLATVYPTGAGQLWVEQLSDDLLGVTVASISVTPATGTVAVGAIVKLTATATYTDASTLNVSHFAAWTTSNPARATVDEGGYVTGVASGAAATITATYQGQNDTTAITVS